MLAGRFENLTFSFCVGSGSSCESLFLFFLLNRAMIAASVRATRRLSFLDIFAEQVTEVLDQTMVQCECMK